MTAKNFVQIYALLVCFIATLVLLFSLCTIVSYTTHLMAPTYSYYDELSKYASNEAYLRFNEDTSRKPTEAQNQPADKLEALRLNDRQVFLEEKHIGNIMGIISFLQYIGIAALFLYIHYRIYKRVT